MAETNYTAIVDHYLRTLGNPRDEVMTAIRPWLERDYGLSYAEAARVRSIALNELKDTGQGGATQRA
ncbi:MAG: hypothetical protein ACRDQB_15375 [Thermocrispum sp.]